MNTDNGTIAYEILTALIAKGADATHKTAGKSVYRHQYLVNGRTVDVMIYARGGSPEIIIDRNGTHNQRPFTTYNPKNIAAAIIKEAAASAARYAERKASDALYEIARAKENAMLAEYGVFDDRGLLHTSSTGWDISSLHRLTDAQARAVLAALQQTGWLAERAARYAALDAKYGVKP